MRLDLDPWAIFGCNIAKWTILCIDVHFQPVIKLLQKGVRVHQKRDFDAKNSKIFWGGAQPPPQTPPPVGRETSPRRLDLNPPPPFWNSAYATGPRGHTFELKLQKLWASGVFRERRGDGATPFGLIVNFCTVFASFIFRLNRKICVPLLLVTVRVFCQLKAASKCTQSSKLIIFGTKMFFWGGAQPLNYPRPMRLAPFLLKSFTVMGYRRGLIAIFSVGLL